MHLHLTVVCLFWRFFIGRYVTSEDKAAAIEAKLEEINVSTKKVKKNFERQGQGSASEKMPERPSFNGEACFKVLVNIRDFLDFTHAAGTPERARVEAALQAYIALLREVDPGVSAEEARDAEAGGDAASNAPTEWERYWSTQALRDARAVRVQAAARTFVAALASSGVPAEALESVYIHYLTKHIGAQVRQFGPLWAWSGEGLEHKNSIWKKTARGCAQRGLAGHQNGGQRPRNGGPQKRKAPGREGQTFTMVVAGEEYGGVQREGRSKRQRCERGQIALR
jgi:hypothetical protein